MKGKILRILCAVSGVAAVALAGLLVWMCLELVSKMGPQTGIIGGAGVPTLIFWLTYLLPGSSVFWWFLAAVAVFVTTLILLRKGRK